MPASEHLLHEASAPANGHSTAHDLFVLTDEQILEIEPEAHTAVTRVPLPVTREEETDQGVAQVELRGGAEARQRDSGTGTSPKIAEASHIASAEHGSRNTGHDAQPGMAVPQEAPAWLAAQMKDPWSGEEARELWNGVLEARQEAADYRAAIATPEDAKALKELYPGGVNEARAAANRARLLDQIDQAYFGTAGKPAEETSATRAKLATMMLREDPAAFREMVFAGVRVLEEANAAPPFRAASSSAMQHASTQDSGLKPGAAQDVHQPPVTSHQSLVSAYAEFEKAANEDLERSVGTAITRTIEQALPNLKGSDERATVGARSIVPLQGRLAAAVRHDVESALKGDRQLGEQIAQILYARRFDNEVRTQVVRLIDDRARQLVPVAAKRVLNDWTQTTLAAHRGNSARGDAASSRREVAPASVPASPTGREQTTQNRLEAGATRPNSRRIDYRKLSDEQILEL